MALTTHGIYTIETIIGRSAKGEYPGAYRILDRQGNVVREVPDFVPGFPTAAEAETFGVEQGRGWIDSQTH